MLTLSVCAAQNKKLINKSHHLLCSMWDLLHSSWTAYCDSLVKLEPTSHALIFGSYFLDYLKKKNQIELISKCKVIDCYKRNCLLYKADLYIYMT